MSYPKFLIVDNTLILGYVEQHRQLLRDQRIVDGDVQVKGGGWFRFDEANKRIILFGESFEFGPVKLHDALAAVQSKRVFDLYKNIFDRYSYYFDTGSEIVSLKD